MCFLLDADGLAVPAGSIGPLNLGFLIADFRFFWFSFSIRIPSATFRNPYDIRVRANLPSFLLPYNRKTPILVLKIEFPCNGMVCRPQAGEGKKAGL